MFISDLHETNAYALWCTELDIFLDKNVCTNRGTGADWTTARSGMPWGMAVNRTITVHTSSFKSCPAEKAGPVWVSIITRRFSSSAVRSACSASSMARERAFLHITEGIKNQGNLMEQYNSSLETLYKYEHGFFSFRIYILCQYTHVHKFSVTKVRNNTSVTVMYHFTGFLHSFTCT